MLGRSPSPEAPSTTPPSSETQSVELHDSTRAKQLAVKTEQRPSVRRPPPRTDSDLEHGETLQLLPKPTWHQSITRASSILAATFFLVIITLQILALVKAANLSRAPPPIKWCSPLFQPYGIAVRDGNCVIHPIDQSENAGIGCITLPGIQQAGWIAGTVWGTSLSLIIEIVDIIILSTTSKSARWRGIKMRRPWCTLFMGAALLLVMLVFSGIYSMGLPEGITSSIWIVVQAGDRLVVYEGKLRSAGMRGEFIGWLDAVFGSWNTIYNGEW